MESHIRQSWTPAPVDKSELHQLTSDLSLDPLTATILLRRGVRTSDEILFYATKSLRFQHSPFLFNSMEAACDRILDAQKRSQRVMIFGDKDTDGITATALLYEVLSNEGIDATYRVPQGEDGYGLTTQAVEKFARDGGQLIITVDCGISNATEIQTARLLGVDVIVLDHHNPSSAMSLTVRQLAIALDAKMEGSGYPFCDICGCALAYKVAQALRFTHSDLYKVDVALLDARVVDVDGSVHINCIMARNLVEKDRLHVVVETHSKCAQNSLDRVLSFIKDRLVVCWDSTLVRQALQIAFGQSIDVDLVDMQSQIGEFYPKLKDAPIESVKTMSTLAHYTGRSTEIDAFFNLFVSYTHHALNKAHPDFVAAEQDDVQLVALASLADVMPMKGENRLFVKNGIDLMHNIKSTRRGIKELLSRLNLLGKPVSSTDLSWKVTPTLNASGRLGQADLGVRLLLEKDGHTREIIANQIAELNEQRKDLTRDAEYLSARQAQESVDHLNGKLCFVYDERINRGVAGILAAHFAEKYLVPTMAATKVGQLVVGSMRSRGGLDCTQFLTQLDDLLESYGGHRKAGGFTLLPAKLAQFRSRLEDLSKQIKLTNEDAPLVVDAQLPPSYMSAQLEKVVEFFEPYGEANPKLLFAAYSITVVEAYTVGRSEKQHLKLIVDCGKSKWPCIFWGEGHRLGRSINVGDKVDILFNIERNYYNGMKSLNLILCDIRRS